MSEPVDISTELARALTILGDARDIVAGRHADGDTPSWAQQRGWADYLARLTDEQLLVAERDPAGFFATQPGAPESLRRMAHAASTLAARWQDVSAPEHGSLERHVKRRKQAQLDAFSAVAVQEFAGVTRIVDLGSGHGHLTRALARALRPEHTLGIDWDDERIARAIDLAGEGGPRFVHADAHGAGADVLALRAGDLVVGLHPCGDLGDALVTRARDARTHVLAVSCCFQKTAQQTRLGLSQQATAAGFSVPKHALGLANLSPVSFEGSGSLVDKRAWRETRLGLRYLLEARGVALEPGEEARGVPKDRVRQGLAEVAALSFAKRGLPHATPRELADASARSANAYATIARTDLPRHALSRVLELAIVLDRARLLEESGFRTRVVTLFSSRTSPRNLAIVAVAPS